MYPQTAGACAEKTVYFEQKQLGKVSIVLSVSSTEASQRQLQAIVDCVNESLLEHARSQAYQLGGLADEEDELAISYRAISFIEEGFYSEFTLKIKYELEFTVSDETLNESAYSLMASIAQHIRFHLDDPDMSQLRSILHEKAQAPMAQLAWLMSGMETVLDGLSNDFSGCQIAQEVIATMKPTAIPGIPDLVRRAEATEDGIGIHLSQGINQEPAEVGTGLYL